VDGLEAYSKTDSQVCYGFSHPLSSGGSLDFNLQIGGCCRILNMLGMG